VLEDTERHTARMRKAVPKLQHLQDPKLAAGKKLFAPSKETPPIFYPDEG
jgi:hypothetical protein